MTNLDRPSAYAPDLDASTLPGEAHAILVNKVSWGAVFAGVVMALVVQVLLTMLGAGIGIATLDPGTSDNPDASTFSIIAGIWYVLSGIVAAYAGGFVAGRMSGKTHEPAGGYHGLTTWAMTTLLVLYFLTTTIGAIVGGALSSVATAVGGLGETVATAAAPAIAESNPLDALESQVRATGTDPEALNSAAVNSLRDLMMSDEADAATSRQQAAQALSTARGIPLEQATQQVASMETQYRDSVEAAKQTATDAASATASATSMGAIFAFIGLVLGAGAAWVGGRSGVRNAIS